jgi:Fic family protein
VIEEGQHFPGRERDQSEVKGYYAALDEAERLAEKRAKIAESTIQKLHALVVADGKTRVKPTPYRTGQNVIRDSRSGRIVYMPPEAKDVPDLMAKLVAWINQTEELPVPIKAGIAHYPQKSVNGNMLNHANC